MRILEWVVLGGIVILGIQLIYKKEFFSSAGLKFMAGFVFLVTIGQWVLEGYRWQIAPLYLLAILLFLFAFLPKTNNVFIKIQKTLFILLMFIFIMSVVLLPLPKLPVPQGEYQVGTKDYYFVDLDRKELYGANSDMQRELMVQVWYPIDVPSQGERALWMRDMRYFAPEIGERFGIPGFMLEHLIYVESNSYFNENLSEAKLEYPVVLFSHGWLGFKEQNIYQVEELASQGFIVIGVNHTYGAMMTVFPDGRAFARNRDALPEGVTDEEYYVASNTLVRQWADDLGFVLKEFEQINADSSGIFFEKMRLETIGVMGHSTGGGASVEFCFENPRCAGLLGMDPWLEPVSRDKLVSGQTVPMLLMFSDAWAVVPGGEGNKPSVELLVTKSEGWTSEMVISDTMHFDFSITPVISPLTEILEFKGALDGDRILEIINAYTVAFFNQFLLDKPTDMFSEDSGEFPEVMFSVK